MCRNWKLWSALGVLGLLAFVAAPDARATVLPILFAAACPLSMVVMAVAMGRGSSRGRNQNDDQAAEQLPAR